MPRQALESPQVARGCAFTTTEGPAWHRSETTSFIRESYASFFIAGCCARGYRPRGSGAAPQRYEVAPPQVEHAASLQVHRHHTPAIGCLGSVGLPHLHLADGGSTVFGADLNCSESRC